MYGDKVLFNMGSFLNVKMASIAQPNGWRWPRSRRNPVVMEIIAPTPSTFFPNLQQEDSVFLDLDC